MSEFITHAAVYEDSARLALISPGVCEPFKQVVRKYWDIGSLGSLSRGGDNRTVELLEYCREHWAGRRDGDYLEQKLAYLIGWRTHNAADRHFKPIYRQLQPEHYQGEVADPDEKFVSDIRIYHDTILYREVYDTGRLKPFSPHFLEDAMSGHPAGGAVAVGAVESALAGVIQRSLLELQSFTKKEKDPEAWFRRFERQRQDFYVDAHKFARAVETPDPNFVRRFILENNFYEPRDPIIRLARALQRNTPRPDVTVDQAVEQAKEQSQYAQTLRQAYLYIAACSEFWDRKIGVDELKGRLHLGTAHFTPLGGKK